MSSAMYLEYTFFKANLTDCVWSCFFTRILKGCSGCSRCLVSWGKAIREAVRTCLLDSPQLSAVPLQFLEESSTNYRCRMQQEEKAWSLHMKGQAYCTSVYVLWGQFLGSGQLGNGSTFSSICTGSNILSSNCSLLYTVNLPQFFGWDAKHIYPKLHRVTRWVSWNSFTTDN